MNQTSQIIPQIVAQHAEEAAFLWLLRDAAVYAPHYTLSDLKELDNRVDAHIDGLRIAGDAGWEFCEDGLKEEEPGEVFAAATMALDRGSRENLEQVFAVAQSAPELSRALIAAFGWAQPNKWESVVQDLLTADSQFDRRIAIGACAIRRVNPGAALTQALASDDAALCARACKAVGELGLTEHARALLANTLHSDDDCRFWASWSAVLTGQRSCIDVLNTFTTPQSPFCERALQVLLRALSATEAHSWLETFATQPGTARLVVQGAGIIGNPVFVPWLIGQMHTPELARVAGESFSSITGVDIAYDDLEGEWPEDFEAGPTEDPEDENVEMDADEDLPWPEPTLIEEWWREHGVQFGNGNRYLVGEMIRPQMYQHALDTGTQRQRCAVALEMGLDKADSIVCEMRAPGYWQ